jgi:hypothetical protein
LYQDLVDTVMSETQVKVPTGIFVKGSEIEISRAQAMWLYNQYKNENTHSNFDAAGLTKDVVNNVFDILTEQDKKYADYLVDEYYPSMYQQLNPVFRRLFFRDLPMLGKYAGKLEYQGVAESQINDLMTEEGFNQSTSSLYFGSGIERQNNNRAINLNTDVFQSVFNYTQGANAFISGAEIYRDIKKIIKDDDFRKNVEKFNVDGKVLLKNFEDMVDVVFGKQKDAGSESVLINALVSFKIITSLAFSPKLLVQQLASTSLWLSKDKKGEVMSNAIAFLGNPKTGMKYLRELRQNSEYLENRYGSGNFKKVEAAYIAAHNKIGYNNKISRNIGKLRELIFERVALMNIMIGDAGGMYILGVPYYKAKKDEGLKRFNGDEPKAIEYAVQEFTKMASKSQQSYQSNDRDLMQHTQLGKIMNMYGNSPKQYHRNSIQAIIELKRMFKGEEFKGSGVDNAWKLFMNHVVQGAMYAWAQTAYLGLLSEDDEDDSKIKDLIWGAAFGSFSKYFIVGDIIQNMWDSIVQGRRFGQTNELPIYTSFSEYNTRMMKYLDVVEKNDPVAEKEALREVILGFANMFGMPIERVDQIIANYDKVLSDKTLTTEEDILRLLNYTDYSIDNSNPLLKYYSDKRKQLKANQTKARRKAIQEGTKGRQKPKRKPRKSRNTRRD